VVLAVVTAFPVFSKFQDIAQKWLVESLVPDNIARQVLGYLTLFAGKANKLGLAGLVVLVLSVLAMIFTIDRTLNAIWRVRTARSLGQRMLIYWTAMTVGPLIFGLSVTMTSYAISASKGLVAGLPGGVGLLLDTDAFGRSDSLVASQTILLGASLFKGSTAFKPPELEFHISLGLNANYAVIGERGLLSIASSRGPRRHDQFLALQEAFIDYHLRNVSDHYDFDSLRIGIQPFSSDFRGFLFQDNQLGIRLFGNRDNNKFQYNLAGFVLVEKDTNSGLNDVGQSLRKDAILVANLYRQDLPVPGITSQITLIYNANREGREVHYDSNGFPVRPALIGNLRPRDYDIVYLGYNLDGHLGRINLTGSVYGALGEDRNSIFTDKAADVRAWFAALEPSIDLDWIRVRLSGLYASGDHNPYDDKETGFDAISENPLIAGADTSYWIRQSVPFVGGGRGVSINGRNGVLNALRSSKDEGQSNFNNPGTILLGAGADLDLTPNLRVSGNLIHIWFADTAVIQALRQEGSIPNEVGWDYSVAAIWRPLMSQNIVFRLSAAALDPGAGFKDLFTDRARSGRFYSVLLNTVLAF
jgi:hypothetical protein